MNDRVLFVDDEPNVLQAYQRALRKQIRMDTALGGKQALEMIANEGPYAVIISDMRMPVMNGVEFLAAAKQQAPETVRMMLTGNSDQQTAIDAVNEGDIFRFLNKPCPPDVLGRAISAGLEQHRLITAEKELLENTLNGSIRVLAEVLSLVNPEAFGRMARLRKISRRLVDQMALPATWWLEPLVLMSQIGCVILPSDVLKKVAAGDELSHAERRLYEQHPVVGAELLAKIPRMEEIAACIRYQDQNFDGSNNDDNGPRGTEIPMGGRILKVILDFDQCEVSGLDRRACLARLKQQAEKYDPAILAALEKIITAETPASVCKVSLDHVIEGMVLASDVMTTGGARVLCKGQEITASVRQRLMNFKANGAIVEPLAVFDETIAVVRQMVPDTSAQKALTGLHPRHPPLEAQIR